MTRLASSYRACGKRIPAALRAATSVAASVCNIADRKGMLAVGRDADILAVEGNPIVNLAALHDVRAVFRAGVRA
jgi:imidazolonepropionase-like amidohydrolase